MLRFECAKIHSILATAFRSGRPFSTGLDSGMRGMRPVCLELDTASCLFGAGWQLFVLFVWSWMEVIRPVCSELDAVVNRFSDDTSILQDDTSRTVLYAFVILRWLLHVTGCKSTENIVE